MEQAVSRRWFLTTVAAVGGGGAFAAGQTRARQSAGPKEFSPVEHGFGFRNWSPRSQYFDAPTGPPPGAIRETVRTEWGGRLAVGSGTDPDRLPRPLVEAIATQLRTAIAQYAGTNGHCYGMVLAAQQYFERPETIPVDRPRASQIDDPTVPVDRPEAPVYEAIVDLQASQFLRFRAWLGRRAMVHPDWIDTGALLADVRSVVRDLGTASLVVFNDTLYSHQVLAYDYVDGGASVEVPIYDPNRPAASYRSNREVLRFDRVNGSFEMQPYRAYTGALFNRYDRIELATGRENAGPTDHLTVDRSTVRSSLFPLAMVLVDADAVDLAVVDPHGVPFERVRGTHMDRRRGEYARMRTRYGAVPGPYHVTVFGTSGTAYELRVLVSDLDGEVIDETRTSSIETGECHEYELEVPGSGRGTVTRAPSGGRPSGLVGAAGAAGAVGGVAAGALGYRTMLRRRHGGPGEEERP